MSRGPEAMRESRDFDYERSHVGQMRAATRAATGDRCEDSGE